MKFEDILIEYNIPTAPEGHHHARHGWIQFDCPYCGKDSEKWHMGYSIERHYVNCWRCGSHSLINTVMMLTDLSYRQVKKILDVPDFIRPDKKIKTPGKLKIPPGVGKLYPAHKKYLQSRGFDWRQLKRLWGIKGIGISSRLPWRIWIPIHHRGEIVSWTTRSISKSGKITRYISAKEEEESIPHKTLLYGADFVRHAAIALEGPVDVWRIGPGAVATFGSGYSSEQVEQLAKFPTRAICFDNEPEAQKRAKKLSDDLAVFPGDTYNVVLDRKDAGEEDEKNIRKLRKAILE